MNNINNISPTLQSKLYLEEMKRQGKNVYNFGLGENAVDQPHLYIEKVKEYAHKKEYASCEGISSLNNQLKQIYNTEECDYNIIVGNGLKEILFIVQTTFKGKIIHITPSWVSYSEHMDLLGKMDDLIEIQTSIDNDFRIDCNELESILQEYENTPKMILLNYPNNPTGTCYKNQDLENMATLLRKYQCLVFADEIYVNLVYRDNQKSIAHYLPELTLRGSSVSKDYACGGYRVGWCAFPSQQYDFFEKCRNYASRVYSCAPVPIQYATADLLANKIVCTTYVEKLKLLFQFVIKEVMDILIPTRLKFPYPCASWYVYIDFSNYRDEFAELDIHDSIALSMYFMKKHNIVTVAAAHFRDSSFALRFSLVDFHFNVETCKSVETVNIENMKNGFRELVRALEF